MSKRDNVKTAKYQRHAHVWVTDLDPSKKQRTEKRKERQVGKKESYKALREFFGLKDETGQKDD